MVGAGVLLAVAGFVVALGVIDRGFLPALRSGRRSFQGLRAPSEAEPLVSRRAPRSVHGMPAADVIDAEYRVIS